MQKRGGQGVFTLKTGGRNGSMIAALQVTDEDQVMMMTDSGRLVRIRLNGVSVIGRNTQGVKLIGCKEGERVIGAVRVAERPEDDEVEDEFIEGAELAGDEPVVGTDAAIEDTAAQAEGDDDAAGAEDDVEGDDA